MSLPLTILLPIAGGVLNSLLFGVDRAIADVEPDVVIEELHHDDLQITHHPVERGAAITDHSFKLPSVCEMRIGFSDSGFLKLPHYAKRMYHRLLELQASRQLITVSTGKRLYVNMLISGISTESGIGTENSALIVVRLQQLLIAVTTTTAVPAKEVQAAPATSAPTQSTGTQQAAPVTSPPQSLLSRGADAVRGFLGGK